MKKIAAALGALVMASSVAMAEEPKVHLFVVAHQDDWQLFMNPAASQAVQAGEPSVFVHITAGDAGRGEGGDIAPYYAAREEGALRAVRFLVNAKPQTGSGARMLASDVEMAGRRVARFEYGPTTTYFLRLPDGAGDGLGYDATGRQSLAGLKTGKPMTAINGGAHYAKWSDLVATLKAITKAELRDRALVIHVGESDAALNPGDHPDHLHASLAMQEAAKAFPCATIVRHDTYDTRSRPLNVEGTDLMLDVGTWAATASGLSDGFAHSTWDPEHNSWVGRDYHRTTGPSEECRKRN